jgi:hypothetical protein
MSSIRSDSGLGIAAAAATVLLLRRWRWWRLLPALAVLAGSYLSINALVFSALRADRDRRLGSTARTLDITTAHTLWHTAYAGLGYLPNKYDLRFKDDVPHAVVQREAPRTVFLSNRYETLIRKAYLRFVRGHPVEVARQYAAKLIVILADTAPYLLIVLLTLPMVLLLSPDRRAVRRWCLLAVPTVIVALLPVVVAVPMESYEQGLYGAIGVVGIVGLCSMLKLVEIAVCERGGVRSMLAGAKISWSSLTPSRTPLSRGVRLSIVAVAMLIALSLGGYLVRREADRWQGDRSGVLMEGAGI